MKTLTRSSFLTTSSVGPSRFASTGVLVFVSERWTLTCWSGRLVSSGPGRGATASDIGMTLVHDCEEVASLGYPLELVRSAVDELNTGPGAQIADGTGDEDLPGCGRGGDARREMHVDSPDRVAGTFDLADVNPGSDPHPEFDVGAGDRSHAVDRSGRTFEGREDTVAC